MGAGGEGNFSSLVAAFRSVTVIVFVFIIHARTACVYSCCQKASLGLHATFRPTCLLEICRAVKTSCTKSETTFTLKLRRHGLVINL